VIVDDDPAVRDSTTVLLEQAGHTVHAFETGAALIEAGIPENTDVILLDLLMPGLGGLETLRLLQENPDLPPVILLTGHGDVPSAVEAMKLGAVEFLEKPYPMRQLLELVSTVKSGSAIRSGEGGQRREALEKVARLTVRQREILKGIALGEASKNTAHRLGLSVRTVEAYRGHVFERLGIRGMADAVRIAVLAGLVDG